MNKITIKKEDSLFDNFIPIRREKGKLFDAFAIVSLIYILFMSMELIVDIKERSLKSFNWQLAIALLSLPVIGLIFSFAGKKIGWIVSFFYYLTVMLLVLYGRAQDFSEKKNILKGWVNWRLNLLLLLTFATTALLLSTPVRRYFEVRPLLLCIIVAISVGLVLLAILALSGK